MSIVQFEIDAPTSAELAYLAEIQGKGKMELLEELASREVSRQFAEIRKVGKLPARIESPTRPRRQGSNGQRVMYEGNDPRLEAGKVYLNYAQVLRIVRHELANRLYVRKTGKGTTAPHLLKRYEPEVYTALKRV